MLGPFGQFPLALGGGKPRALRAFEQIRRALGNATAAGGIDELIRRAEAKGLAASTTHRRRAVRQAFPRLSRAALGYYERAMYRTPRPGEPAATRAATVSALWLGNLLNGETLTTEILAGSGLIVAGLALHQLGSLRSR